MTLDGIAGRLQLRPGQRPSVRCERPMVGAALIGRLTEGRRAVLLPELLASVFTLGPDAQRSTSRRAVKAAFGMADAPADAARDAAQIALHAARDQLQRFALDLPMLTQAPDAPPPPVKWLRDVPPPELPAGDTAQAVRDAWAALDAWLQRRLYGMPCAQWLAAWDARGGDWLADWCAGTDHAVARWLGTVHDVARATALPCRPLDVLDGGDEALRELAAALEADAAYPERPRWRGAPAETGPWTRRHLHAAQPAATLWDRLGARIAEPARLAQGLPLARGAVRLRDGVGMAWTEMSRGLLVHWIELAPGEREPDSAHAARYRVLAPTEWNFHPEGAFGEALARDALGPAALRVAAACLDPCVAFEVVGARDA